MRAANNRPHRCILIYFHNHFLDFLLPFLPFLPPSDGFFRVTEPSLSWMTLRFFFGADASPWIEMLPLTTPPPVAAAHS